MRVSAGESTKLSAAATGDDESNDPLVQYVVLRRDLWTELGWPLGSIVAQVSALAAATASAGSAAAGSPEKERYL